MSALPRYILPLENPQQMKKPIENVSIWDGIVSLKCLNSVEGLSW